MLEYFISDEIWENYLQELKSWKGTPYRHLQMAKGKGADCALFIGATWFNIGVLKEIVYEYYSRDWYNSEPTEKVLESLYFHFNACANDGFRIKMIKDKSDPLSIDDLMRGDAICFSTNPAGVTNHAAVYIGNGVMVHSNDNARRGVVESQFGDEGRFWHRHLTYAFRIIKEV